MILVSKQDGVWIPFTVSVAIKKTVNTATVSYADGRTETVDVEPYQIDVDLHPSAVLSAVASGAWSDADLAAYGLALAVPFTVPSGKIAVGEPRYVADGDRVIQEYDVEDLPPPDHAAVNAERDRRVSSGFMFAGKLFQSRVEDQKRIAGAATLAIAALLGGAQPGNLRWHEGEEDFAWIASDNSLVTMDALTVIAFGKAAARWEAAHVFAARALKDADPTPVDYTDNRYWPAL